MLEAKSVLASVTEQNVIDILADFGSPVMNGGTSGSGGRYLQFRTVCHGGDSSKLYFYVDSKSFYCYTCCGSMSLFDLVIKVKGLEEKQFYEAVKYVAEFIGYTETKSAPVGFFSSKSFKKEGLSEQFRKTLISKEDKSINHIRPFDVDQKKIDEGAWELYKMDDDYFYQGWIDEGISEDTMRKFDVHFEWTHCYIILPHRDVYGNIVGIRRRSLHPEDVLLKRKYTPYTALSGTSFNHELGQNWYGLSQLRNYQKQTIQNHKDFYIFEGEKSVMKVDTLYSTKEDPGKIAIGACGFNVSTPQIEFFTKYNIPENYMFGAHLSKSVYICFDKDFDVTQREQYATDKNLTGNFNHYINKLISICEKFCSYGWDPSNVYVLIDKDNILEDNDSPIDKGKESFERLIDNAVHLDELRTYLIEDEDVDVKGN